MVARRVIYAAALIGVVYLFARYDTFDVPDAGCSPVAGVAPGSRLIIDRWASGSGEQDVVLFRTDDGLLHLGRIVTPPQSVELDRGSVWIEIDDPLCPDYRSEERGALPREQLVARVLVAF